eukprot:m51a1_g6385 hypothetical protein (301) ;mRNA; r:187920-189490
MSYAIGLKEVMSDRAWLMYGEKQTKQVAKYGYRLLVLVHTDCPCSLTAELLPPSTRSNSDQHDTMYYEMVDDRAIRTGRRLRLWLIAVLVLALLAIVIDGVGRYIPGIVLDCVALALLGAGFFGAVQRNRIALILYAVGECVLMLVAFVLPVVYFAVALSHIHIKHHSSSGEDDFGSSESEFGSESGSRWSSDSGMNPAVANLILWVLVKLFELALGLVVFLLMILFAVWAVVLGIKIFSVVLAVRMWRQLDERPSVGLSQQERGPSASSVLTTTGANAQSAGYVPPHMQSTAPGQIPSN